MKTLTKFILLLTVIGIPGFAKAQIPESLSLQEAINYAIKHSWTMKQAHQDVDIAKAKVWETITDGLPEVNASSDYSKNLDIAVTPIPAEIFGGEPGTYINAQFAQEYNASWGINASQLIFDGSYIVGLMASKVYVDLSRNAAIKTKIEIAKATELAYYNVQIAQKGLDLIKETQLLNENLLKETEAKYKAGFVEELDVERLRLAVKRSVTEQTKAERLLKLTQVVLNYALGVENLDTQFTLTDNLDILTHATENSITDIAFTYDKHIDYILLQNQWKAQDLLYKNTIAKNLPRVNAFYNYGKNTFANDDWNLYKNTQPWFKSSIVGLSISMPIIGFGKMWSQAKQEKIAREQIEYQLEATQMRINKDLLTALTDMQYASETYLNEKENLKLAKKIFNTAQIKYKNGVGSSMEVIQGEQEVIQSRADYINSISNLASAKIQLDKALSKL